MVGAGSSKYIAWAADELNGIRNEALTKDFSQLPETGHSLDAV